MNKSLIIKGRIILMAVNHLKSPAVLIEIRTAGEKSGGL